MKTTTPLLCATMIWAITISCNNGKNPLEFAKLIRPAIQLSSDDIPALRETMEFRAGERPRLWEVNLDEGEVYYVVRFRYRWNSTDEDFVSVDFVVAETMGLAYKYLYERRSNSSIPPDSRAPKDQPTVAGDISYSKGRLFIRNNINIHIDAEGEFRSKTTEIARQIDAVLLQSPISWSADQWKPVIADFQIVQNPVKWRSITPLAIHVKDPMNGTLYYDWRFTSETGGGIEINSSENYYYYADTEEPIEELTLIAVNNGGFFSTATIDIHVEH